FNRMGECRVAAQTPAGRVEDDRPGAQVEVRGRVAAVPRRMRPALRSLQAPRSGGAAGEGGCARSDHPGARIPGAPEVQWRGAGAREAVREGARSALEVAAGAGSAAPG